MSFPGPRLLLIALIAPAVVATGASRKSEENPLERMEPVAADQPIPIIDFFRPAVFRAPAMNPGGTHFAALVSTGEDRRDLAVFEIASDKVERLSGGNTRDIRSYAWVNDDRLLFSITDDKYYAAGLSAVDRRELSRTYPLSLGSVVSLLGFPRSEPDSALVWIQMSATARGDDGGVLRIDTARGPGANANPMRREAERAVAARILKRYPPLPDGDPFFYLTDNAGELAYGVTAREGKFALFRLNGDEWTRCPVDPDQCRIYGVGDTPDQLLVQEPPQENAPRAIRTMDAATGELGDVVFADEAYDFVDAEFYRHPVDGRLLGVHYDRKGPDTQWIDPTYQGLQRSLQEMFPRRAVKILGSDRAEKNFLIRAFSDTHPSTYYHVNMDQKTTRRLSSVAPWFDPARMQPMRLLTYKARDGRSVDGYVTLPAGTSKETPAPLIVLPHGGPWARDTWDFHPEVQFLASRGYAVFQPNYRGSDGTAWRFPAEDLWDFRKMHDDVTDGVQALLRTGLIDRDRIAIMGGSFGGYLAICGAAYEAGLYRCAITIAGVFDWEMLMRTARRNDQRNRYATFERKLGDPRKEKEKFEEISPLRAVDRITIPVFVAHGYNDPVADIEQSRRLIAELKKHHVPLAVQIEHAEGHGFRYLTNVVELYSDIERFLAEHLAPQAAPPAGAVP